MKFLITLTVISILVVTICGRDEIPCSEALVTNCMKQLFDIEKINDIEKISWAKKCCLVPKVKDCVFDAAYVCKDNELIRHAEREEKDARKECKLRGFEYGKCPLTTTNIILIVLLSIIVITALGAGFYFVVIRKNYKCTRLY